MTAKPWPFHNAHKRKMIRRIERGAKIVSDRHLIYSYGGGRNFPANRMDPPPNAGSWTDCSGFAQWLCQLAGIKLKNYVGSTWSLAEEGIEGESAWFTLYIKNNPEGHDEHVIIRLRRKYWVTRKLFGEHRWIECGGSDNPQLGNGPTYFHPTDARIAEFPIHRRFRVL